MTAGDSIVVVLGLAFVALIAKLPLPLPARQLLIAGLFLRILGGQAYYYLTEIYYGGSGDYRNYYAHGVLYAQSIQGGYDETGSYWLEHGGWCCTAFTIRTTGVLIFLFDVSIHGLFVTFGLVGYVGILSFAVVGARVLSPAATLNYVKWLVFFPSLWYWPAALGKDALLLAGIGVAFLGHVGSGSRPSWLHLLSGSGVVVAVRPQVGAVVMLSLVAGYWLSTGSRLNGKRILEGTALLLGCAFIISLAGGALGVELLDADDVTAYLDRKSELSAVGGSALEVDAGGTSPISGAVNVFLRPFLWEASGVTGFLAGMEVLALWVVAWVRRRSIGHYIRNARRDRLFWAGVVFVVLYGVSLGMAVANQGIIARQRVHLLPMVVLILSADAIISMSRPRWMFLWWRRSTSAISPVSQNR